MNKALHLIKFLTVLILITPLSAYAKNNIQEDLVIVGSGSGSATLISVGRAFMQKYPHIRVSVPKSIGSGGGVYKVGNDENKIGRIARKLAKDEAYLGLVQVDYAKVPIAFFVNNSVKITNITHSQINDIYAGSIRRWEQLNGGEGKIRVIRREEGDSSLRVLLETVPGFNKITFTERAKTTFSDPSTIVEGGQQQNSIAYGTYANIKKNPLVKVLAINNIHPTDNNYPYTGTLSLIFKEKNNKGAINKFLKFLSSEAAKEAIINASGMPVN